MIPVESAISSCGIFDQLFRTHRTQLKFLIKSHKSRSFFVKCRELYRKSAGRSRGDFQLDFSVMALSVICGLSIYLLILRVFNFKAIFDSLCTYSSLDHPIPDHYLFTGHFSPEFLLVYPVSTFFQVITSTLLRGAALQMLLSGSFKRRGFDASASRFLKFNRY